MRLHLSVLLLASAGLVGCSDKSSSPSAPAKETNSDSSSDTNNSPKEDPVANEPKPEAENNNPTPPANPGPKENPTPNDKQPSAADYIGKYSYGCVVSPDEKYSFTNDLTISSHSMVSIFRLFEGKTCETVLEVSTATESLKFVASKGLPGAFEVDRTLTKHLSAIYLESFVADANSYKRCGRTDWKLGVENECETGNASHYDLWMLKNDSLHSGFYDEEHPGSTPETRPIKVSETGIAKKP